MENAGVLRPEGIADRFATTAGADRVEKNFRTSPTMGSVLRRKRLSDISNLTSNGKAPRSYEGGGKENAAAAAIAPNKDAAYMAKLLMENTALMRAVADRKKILEVKEIENQNLHIALQSLSQQNQQLAQANSHMLAEQNIDKDRLKAFQHELGCCQAALKVKTSQLEEKKKVNKEPKALLGTEHIREMEMQIKLEQGEREVPIQASHKRACNTNRKRTHRSQSLGSATINHQISSKEKDRGASTKSLRRKSIGVRHSLCIPTEDLFEIEHMTLPVISLGSDPTCQGSSSSGQDNSATPLVSSRMPYAVNVKEVEESLKEQSENQQDRNQSTSAEDQKKGIRRTSIGRPMRRAAEKVSSYKEKPLNVKMRRS